MLQSVHEVLRDAVRSMRCPSLVPENGGSLIQALSEVSNILKGWGNQYAFCTDRQLLRNLDREVDRLLRDFLGFYRDRRQRCNERGEHDDARRLLGLHLLADSKHDPIPL